MARHGKREDYSRADVSPLVTAIIRYGWKLYGRYSGQLARKAFTWTIAYLALLFAALPADHYCRF